jgi:hypothetical protein
VLTVILFRDEHLALQPVGVAEEEAAHRAEVVDLTVACTMLDETLSDRLEAFDGRGLQAEVVEPAASPHRLLPVWLGVAFDGEYVEFGVGTDANRRHGLVALITVRLGGADLSVKDLGLERTQRVDVLSYQRNVIDAIQ